MRSAPGLPFGRLFGINIRVHWSVLLIATLLTWGLATEILPLAGAQLSSLELWGLGVVGAVVLFASLTAHELAHSLVARRRGLKVEGITLWVFGGVSQVGDDWGSPRTELLVAAAGPVVSLVLGALFLGGALVVDAMGGPGVAVYLLQWLSIINVMLLIFNLLPAFPLDGGRILRSIIWMVRGDRDAATRAAARGGRVMAFLLATLAVADLVFGGDLTGSVWLLFVAWFLDSSAKREASGERLRQAIAGVRVSEAMSQPVTVPSWITVQLLLEQAAGRPLSAGLVTHGLAGEPEGLVTVQALRLVSPNKRGSTRLRDIAVPLTSLPTASPDDLLSEVLPRLSAPVGAPAAGRALVVDEGRMVGMISPADVGRLLMRGHGATPAPPPVPSPPPLA